MVKIENIGLPEPSGALLATAGEKPRLIMVQLLDDNEVADFGREVSLIEGAMDGKAFVMAGMHIREWHLELTPWPDSHISRDPRVGTMAEDTLRKLTDSLLPYLRKDFGELPLILGGYSLGGLFADWAARKTDTFNGIAAVSPSLWIEDWDKFAEANPIHTGCVYLSLGDREEQTKNKFIARVGDRVREESRRLAAELGEGRTVLEWNKGGHFVGSAERTAAGFAWCGNKLLHQ